MMQDASVVLGILAWLLSGAAVLLGGNLTRSVLIGYAFIGCLCLALLVAGAGFLAVVVSILSAVALASIQIFGWMLVDVDRDHLTPTDPPTWVARALAFALLGGGLVLLVVAIGPELGTESVLPPMSSGALGRVLFGPLGGAAVLLGLAIAAALLATMLLLRDDEGGS
jgi:NADH:ubiquinone oxidoreductase subunit 6 (subunit J)